MLADLRYALRLFARSPLFSAAVVLVLGLGVGASTTVFTLVDAYLVKPLPFREPDRLVSIWTTRRPNAARDPFSQPDFLDLKEQAASFSELAIVGSVGLSVSGGAGAGREAPAEHVFGSKVSADYFPLLGAGAALGRTFTADEDAPGRDQVVVLSDALWRRRFGADPAAVGKSLLLDGKPYQIVGVMPADFRIATNLRSTGLAGFWLPAAVTRESATPRGSHSWHVVGRLQPGASLAAADAEVRGVAARLEQAYPDTNANSTFYVMGLHDHLVERIKPSLTLLFASTLLLLVIASANVALLLLARASAREGEVAVRAALGASRGRLVRQLLAESVLLALGGGLVGFALSFAGTGLVASGYRGAAMALHDARPDGRVLAFSLLLSSAAGLGFGLVPAFRASKARLYELLKEGAARSTSSGQRRRLQAALLVAEVALSAVLLAGSAAVARGFYQTLNEPLGFRAERALTFNVSLPQARYPDRDASRAFFDAALAGLRTLPAVSSVGAANFLPIGGSSTNGSFEIEGKPPWPRGAEPWAMLQLTEGDYVRSMGMPLLRGRALDERDGDKGARVMVVSESFVTRFLPGEDPIGRRVRWGDSDAEPWHEIVGVVGDVRYSPWEAELSPATYVPMRQAAPAQPPRFASFVVRTEGDPHALANAARDAVARVDADLPVFNVKTYEERLHESMTDRRFTLALVAAFALSALVLTALGLFGLVSYQTQRRSRELAIRMALGAASADVRRLVLRDTSRLLVAGLALGLPAAFAAGRLLASRLQGVPPADPLTLGATALLLGLVALAAGLAPAQRAARTPPALVLRDE
ncbi:MAG TPA: ABC transporter permease [Polyangiaceae bacterium]|nr:ABC transporter permease [Polyangiaceae bacterium]